MCEEDIFAAITLWIERGFFPSPLNDSNICLVPKCAKPKSMKDLRPVLLCNVVYKMVLKFLVNRLKKCLAKCVSEEQSTFIEGCTILVDSMGDDVCYVSELLCSDQYG